MEALVGVDPDLVVKSEPSDGALFQEDVQIMDTGGVGADANGIIFLIGDSRNGAAANDCDPLDLESTVRSLVSKVRTLEEQITACLEGQPLLYQLFGKCNRLEQRLRAMKKDFDGRFAKMGEGDRGTESGPSTSGIRTHVSRNKAHTDKEKDTRTKETEPSSDGDHGDESDWNPMVAEEEDMGMDSDSTSDSRPPHPESPKPFQCKVCPPKTRACYSSKVNLAKHYTNAHTHSEGTTIIDNEAPEFQEAAAKLKHEARPTTTTTTTKGPTGKQKSDRLPYRTCRHCSQVFSRSSEMHIHVANQHSGAKLTRIPCELCGQSFRRKAGAKEHQLKDHGGLTEKMMTLIQPRRRNFQGREVACPDGCGRSFPAGRRHELAHHLIACRKLKPHQCEECGDRFGYFSALRDHKRFIHDNEGAEPEPCPECGVMVPNRRMKAHLREHAKMRANNGNPAGLLRFFCPISGCGKGFRFAGQLQRHEMSHTGERPFACPHSGCGKTYPHKSQLDSHTLAHTGKPYSCEECGWSFVKPYLLRKHKLSHLKGTAKAKAKEMATAKEEGIIQPTPPQRQPRRYNYLDKDKRGGGVVGNGDQT